MLDRKTAEVLKYLAAFTENGGYKILEETEALAALPQEIGVEKETLRQAIRFLAEREYVALKYEGEGEYCLTTLPKGRTFVESNHKGEEAALPQPLHSPWSVFRGAFFGAFLGALLVAIWL